MRGRSIAAAVVALGLLLAASPVAADDRWRVGASLGSIELDRNVTPRQSAEAYWSLHAARVLTPHFELTGKVLRVAVTDKRGFESELHALVPGLRWVWLPRKRVQPIVFGGVGLARLERSAGGVSVDDEGLAFDLGLGVRVALGERRRLHLLLEIETLVEDTFGVESTHNGANLGLTWSF